MAWPTLFAAIFFPRRRPAAHQLSLIHGLGGAKENFFAVFQSPALADCTLATFDQPGTGLAEFDPDASLNVSALADMAQGMADQLLPGPYFLAGASMGGLITLMQMRRHGTGRIKGYINFEGNLLAEDCIFSRRVVSHDLDLFEPEFRRMMGELRASRHVGDQTIAHNLVLNVDIRGYHAYSFETVAESDSGRLLEEFIGWTTRASYSTAMPIRALILKLGRVDVVIRDFAPHFLFYDNPVETFRAVGEFVHMPN